MLLQFRSPLQSRLMDERKGGTSGMPRELPQELRHEARLAPAGAGRRERELDRAVS